MVTKRCTDVCAATLSHVFEVMAEGGFLLLYEMTCSVPMLIWGLDERTWTFTDQREYGLWMAKPRWQAILKEAGLEPVCEHWCAWICHAVPDKLCRYSTQMRKVIQPS